MQRQCYYQCIDGELVLLLSDCPNQCPQNGGTCNDTTGLIITKPCPL